jgi:hypothetical protein
MNKYEAQAMNIGYVFSIQNAVVQMIASQEPRK